MAAFDLFSIGHSNIAAERLVALLRANGINAIADVRTAPYSRFFPWFSAKTLAPLLAKENIGYLPCGTDLGGRPRDETLYCDGIADYEAMAHAGEFQTALERLIAESAERRICMMCTEREPLDCHRCLLLARELAARGMTIGHILQDGTIESHAATEERLLTLAGEDSGLFATGNLSTARLGERLAAAYRHRARAVAYRKDKSPKSR
jgi:uncharacterized protein (DUF488 family)